MITEYLLKKYDCEVPRYTSYPTVPLWEDMPNTDQYITNFISGFNKYNSECGISLYIHLPFCESLCSYCGCNKVITANHGVEERYLHAIINEWYQYRKLMPSTPVVRELHLGGGTPTFFSPENLKRLLNCIFDLAEIHPQRQFSLEGHPNNTTKAHLEILHQLGFSRLSLGVQDYNARVQRVINRMQPYDNVKRVTILARETGFSSVNYDLIYGLPLQTMHTILQTARDTIALRPDRIAYYSYAHIPWKMKAQRLYNEQDLPAPELKAKFYHSSRLLFLSGGYIDIGMDHFALPEDPLSQALQQGYLYRNFMGYTTVHTPFMLGLGVSAISDTGSAYAQNSKELTNYYHQLDQAVLPLQKGYILSDTDIDFRNYINEVACKRKVVFNPAHSDLLQAFVVPDLQALADDGLIKLEQNQLSVTESGTLFLRNVCRAFDLKGKANQKQKKNFQFSKSI
jgi:oxygen-independent coproporphyrinogen-3 oxidase